MKQHMLFVDDEPRVLQGLRRMLRNLRSEWEMHFVGGGPEALELLERVPVRVVVSDMRMPGMDGADLLRRIMRRYPQIVRIALSGESQEESVLRAVGPVHQYLTKPCNSDELKEAIARTVALQEIAESEATRSLVNAVGQIPSPPAFHEQLLNRIGDAEGCLDLLTEAVLEDESSKHRLMQLARVAVPGGEQVQSDVSQATKLLGLNLMTKALVALHVFEQCPDLGRDPSLCDHLWLQGVRIGLMAREICRCERAHTLMQEDTLAASLLLNIASIPWSSGEPVRIQEECWEPGVVLGTTLLSRWALPAVILEVLAYHRYPQRSRVERFGPVAAVHVAHAFEMVESRSSRETGDGCPDQVDEEYLDHIGARDRLAFWRERALEVRASLALDSSDGQRRRA